MKALYLIGGPMGVGKTTVCRALQEACAPCVFLDGDWCWDAVPFQVTEETKTMVLDNICHLLDNFLHCSAYHTVIFCWVMHRQDIIDAILSSLDLTGCRVVPVSLTCQPEELRRRLEQDIRAGLREPDIVERSLSYLPLYQSLNTLHVDTTALSPQAVAVKIKQLSGGAG